jgi:hypothetical protein
MGLFTRRRKQATDTGGLGISLIALRLDEGDAAPAHSTVVVFNAVGLARRAAAGRVSCEQGESVFCFHPGPYTVDLVPFAAAPEWGLRLRFVIDAANPRVTQQRFDLYLYSETAGRLELAGFCVSVEAALQAELAQGALDLPPCTSLEEWHAFRAGLNQLMYTRYGVTVDDCVPVDMGEQIDYADVLKTRAQRAAEAERLAAATATRAHEPPAISAATTVPATAIHTLSAPPPEAGEPTRSQRSPESRGAASDTAASRAAASHPAPAGIAASHATASHAGPSLPPSIIAPQPYAMQSPAQQDARALRRLFLELPALSSALRLLVLPAGLPIFQQHQALLLRLGMAVLNVNTMPALAWAAPDQPLAPDAQARRTAQTLIAQSALDEAWSLLARLQLASPQQWPQLLDEADRICANLETGLSLRRSPHIPRTEPSL